MENCGALSDMSFPLAVLKHLFCGLLQRVSLGSDKWRGRWGGGCGTKNVCARARAPPSVSVRNVRASSVCVYVCVCVCVCEGGRRERGRTREMRYITVDCGLDRKSPSLHAHLERSRLPWYSRKGPFDIERFRGRTCDVISRVAGGLGPWPGSS